MWQSLSLKNGSVTSYFPYQLLFALLLNLIKFTWINLHQNSVNCGLEKFGNVLNFDCHIECQGWQVFATGGPGKN